MPPKSPSFSFQPRDIELLKAIFEHRLLTRNLILPLFGVEVTAEDTNLDRRLRKLTTAGYVCRLPRQNRTTEYVYALTGAGAELLRKHQLPLPFADWAEKNREVKSGFIAHTLMVAGWYVAIVTAVRDVPGIRVEHYERESHPRGHYRMLRAWLNGRGDPRKVNPDALLILAGGNVTIGAHFLEADQATMGLDHRMIDKFEAYAAMYRERRHPALFDVESFRVCLVAKSDARALNLLNLVKTNSDIQPEERKLFWFTSEDAYRKQPTNIFSAIWRSADDGRHLRALIGNPLSRRPSVKDEESPSRMGGLR